MHRIESLAEESRHWWSQKVRREFYLDAVRIVQLQREAVALWWGNTGSIKHQNNRNGGKIWTGWFSGIKDRQQYKNLVLSKWAEGSCELQCVYRECQKIQRICYSKLTLMVKPCLCMWRSFMAWNRFCLHTVKWKIPDCVK